MAVDQYGYTLPETNISQGNWAGPQKEIIVFHLYPFSGAKMLVSGRVTPLVGVITLVPHLFSAIYKGETTPFITCRVPPFVL